MNKKKQKNFIHFLRPPREAGEPSTYPHPSPKHQKNILAMDIKTNYILPMPSIPSPQATLSLGRPPRESAAGLGTRARIPALLGAILLTLLSALLGRRATLIASAAVAWPDLDDEWEYDDEYVDPYAALRTHYHADCDPSILYVIGPRKNRGMAPHARTMPHTPPESARAPPPPPQPPPILTPQAGPPTHVLFVPTSK